MGYREFSTTDVDLDERGQSVLEFVLLLPLLLGLAALMLRMNQAIQVSIVNQKYARQQTLFLTMNNREYPALYQRVPLLAEQGFNQMYLGVSDNAAPETGAYEPEATTARVSRKPGVGSDATQEEPDERGKVRIRTSVALCTQPNVLVSRGRSIPILPLERKDPFRPTGQYAYPTKDFRFDYCRSPTGTADAGGT